MKTDFEELTVRRGDLRVTWEWIGEGMSGDYDPDDPNDEPRLRFSVDQMVEVSGCDAVFWEEMGDSSYATRMPIGATERVLCEAAALLLEAARSPSPKRRFEELSWMRPEDFAEGKA